MLLLLFVKAPVRGPPPPSFLLLWMGVGGERGAWTGHMSGVVCRGDGSGSGGPEAVEDLARVARAGGPHSSGTQVGWWGMGWGRGVSIPGNEIAVLERLGSLWHKIIMILALSISWLL